MRVTRGTIFIAVLALIFLSACRRDEEFVDPPKNLPTQVINDFTLTETSGENVSWRLQAKRADIYDNVNEALVYDVRVDFYEEGVYSSSLTSKEGKIDLLRNNMQARGNVVLVSRKDGAVLKTEELNWDADGSKVYSDAFCTLERGSSVIRGQGFEATPGLESFTTHELNADLEDKEMKDIDTGRFTRKGTPEVGGNKTEDKKK